jgi:nucleotide-binding universal stress UspA family protein
MNPETAPPPDQTKISTSTRSDEASRDPRVVVGIDGSWPARAALRWAARYARATQSVLCAVRVLEWPVGFHSIDSGKPASMLHLPVSDVGQSYRDGMQRIFDEVDPLLGWRLTFAAGETAPLLVQLAEDADLLVIGSREYATSGNARAGDIGHYCISHSRRPVVVVPGEYLKPLPAAPTSTETSDPPRKPQRF